jgi:hypothetical protein
MAGDKLSRLKRFNLMGNGLINNPNGKMVMYSDVHDVCRDEIAGANIVHHVNANPDGNESDNYLCITSDKINLCFTDDQVADAIARFDKKPWLAKPKATKKRTGKRTSK